MCAAVCRNIWGWICGMPACFCLLLIACVIPDGVMGIPRLPSHSAGEPATG